MSRAQCLRSIVNGLARSSRGSLPAAALLRQAAPASQLVASATKAFQVSSVRAFSVSSVVQNELLSNLKNEHKHEVDNYEKPESIVSGPPAPFVLTETPGDTLLTLTRKYNNEDISVDLHVNNQMAPESEDGATVVSFNVSVVKGDKALVFECESDGNELSILHASYEPKEGITQESVFTGPVFDELDEKVQEEFKLYLTARGINADLGEYLRFLIFDKEQREYTAWLKNVADFVSK